VAMAQVLSQPAARAKYHRQALVEPCFAELRERQGLKRFHRRGLAAGRVEFALHCIAFNLKKAVHGRLLVLITLWFRFPVRILALAFSVSHLDARHLPFPSSRIHFIDSPYGGIKRTQKTNHAASCLIPPPALR
jgi:hypothetical protein